MVVKNSIADVIFLIYFILLGSIAFLFVGIGILFLDL